MSFTICKGYLLNRIDYDLFDEIITFINEYGNIFTCIALGVKKIISKNARNLMYGSLIEFEFFNSRSIDKMGKLKKLVVIDDYSIELNSNLVLHFLNKTYYLGKLNGNLAIKKYKENLDLIKNNLDKNILIIKILLDLIYLSGIVLNLNGCSVCKSKKIANFSSKNYGFVCNECNEDYLKINTDVIKIIYLINSNKLNISDKFEKNNFESAIKLLMFFVKENIGIDLYNLFLDF